MVGALEGIRILDFSRVLAGPFCTMLLADLGADVIKVENPVRGDDTREWGPPWHGEQRMSAYFASVNRNKRSLTLNLKHDDGIAIVRELVQQSDILVENFKVGQMAAFGLDYASIRALNPALVYCSITGFGQDGPYSQRAGYDYVVQAMSGLMSITGEPDGRAMKVGVAISDVIAGLFAVSSILAALHHVQKTGKGQHIDIALLDTQIAALVNIVSNVLVSGEDASRYGNQHANIVPYQTFSANDGEFVLAIGNDRQFRLLCHLIQKPQLASDVRFATNPARVTNREALVSILNVVFEHRTSYDWIQLLVDAGIPAGRINSVRESLHDAHTQARDLVQTVVDQRGELLKMVGSPLKLSATPPKITAPPPELGEHTQSILRDVLHYDDEQIIHLRNNSVL